jgi:hypothetical protein
VQIEYLDLQITLRCNAHCANCIKLCGMDSLTGLDYSDTDLTSQQLDAIIADAGAADARIDHLVVTGGEPLLQGAALGDPQMQQSYLSMLMFGIQITLQVYPLTHYSFGTAWGTSLR